MNNQNDSQDSIPQYDAHIIPAESVARQHREGKDFGHTSHEEADGTLSQATEGYTVDKEGLLNNYFHLCGEIYALICPNLSPN
jgi:hypothetical protein